MPIVPNPMTATEFTLLRYFIPPVSPISVVLHPLVTYLATPSPLSPTAHFRRLGRTGGQAATGLRINFLT
jgi:hypothetical protein